MKKQIWKYPPPHYGHRSNKCILPIFAVMALIFATISDDKAISERLKDLQYRLQYCIEDNGHADVQFLINAVFDDFLNVREAMDERDKTELESAMRLLEADIKKLTK